MDVPIVDVHPAATYHDPATGIFDCTALGTGPAEVTAVQ